MSTDKNNETSKMNHRGKKRLNLPWVWDVLLIGILMIAAVLRFTGIEWDGNQHLHPDERFLTMVETSIKPVETLHEYFDTANSSLNPNNYGYTFYVYGTLPIFIVRYVGEWFGQTGYDQINVVGRVLSGAFDLGTLVFVYLVGKRLYRNSRLGLLATLFSAFAVLQIQLSHYFTVDNFANFFTYSAVYAAVCIATRSTPLMSESEAERDRKLPAWLTSNWGSFTLFGLFGLLYGMAMASKVSIWALALLLPLASFLYFRKSGGNHNQLEIGIIIRNLVLAGIIAFLTFRTFQPYSFMGPGFLGMKINDGWLASMRELAAIQSGDVDVPYALQWARRPVTFTLQNYILWGVGIPLGVLSIGGLLWMAWRMIKGDWSKHILLWSWAAFILITQSLSPVKSMRYIISIYPALTLIASWTLFKLMENDPTRVRKLRVITFNWRKALAVTLLVITVAGTVIYAVAFTGIFAKPVTRVAASEWIYENIPGAINLSFTSSETGEAFQQPLAYQNSALIASDAAYTYGFTAKESGKLTSVSIEHVQTQASDAALTSLIATLYEVDGQEKTYRAAGFYQSTFTQSSDGRGEKAVFALEGSADLYAGRQYQLLFEVAEPGVFLRLSGAVTLAYGEGNRASVQYLPPPVYRLTTSNTFQTFIYPRESGVLSEITLNRVVDLLGTTGEKTLTVSLIDPNNPEAILASGSVSGTFLPENDPRGESATITFNKPVSLEKSVGYTLGITLTGEGELGIYNDTIAVESSWDDALPVSMYGYNQFGYWDGIFGNNRNMELYWDDNEEKYASLTLNLDQTDAIFISSSRQWGSITRVPERYPLTTEYYRALIGCPEGKDILWCYSVAKPGMFEGELGFDLVAVFQNDPQIGNIRFNDQFAEEAFTVYDHPKVFIFHKTPEYDSQKVREILGAVDLTTAVHMTPSEASNFHGNLKLSEEESEIQQAGGTWSELFPSTSLLNQKPWLAAVVWYLAVMLLGWIVYPLTSFFLKGLPDRGYAFSRLTGLILLAYFTWLAGSLGVSITRLTIGLVCALLVVASAVVFYLHRKDLLEEIRNHKNYFLLVEGIMLAFFLVDLAIRIGNPDLWHPWKGGEKPMDLSYFTAVVKSTTFPPYDPWYSGGYINYYYYGYVIVGVLVKLLGIIPDVAYNLILPTLFGLTGVGAFGIGWNLFVHHENPIDVEMQADSSSRNKRSLFAGITSAFAVLIMGNLGTIRMFWQGLQRIAAPDGIIDGAGLFERIKWVALGLGKFFTGTKMPFGFGDWYWNPSRAIPGEVITEFPFFTFTYADLHAHMIALPITLLVLAWTVSMLLRKAEWKAGLANKGWIPLLGSLIFGGLIIGTLRPTNTWDLPTYLVFAAVLLFYVCWKYAALPEKMLPSLPAWLRKLIFCGLVIGILAGSVLIFFLPFTEKYGQAYGSIDSWKGEYTQLKDYLVHWGWQLFLITSWLVWETREWLASTPASVLKRFKPYLGYLQVVVVLFAAVLILLTLLGVKIGWLVGILGVWALILMLRSDQPDVKRLVLFMVGTGLVLTLFVELFALAGDIGRMNTVFKFYYQAWTMLGLSAAAGLVWLIPAVTARWKTGVSNVWQLIFALLVFSGLLYPITASIDKIRDRMSSQAPAGLDGTAYMKTSTYSDEGVEMNLAEDYQAIQWMRENVKGSPVIVEANTVEYRWGNRFTIYTGLPGVLGWNWHQRQQRGYLDYNGIQNRLAEIPVFYETTETDKALEFLKKYDVKYIILGQLERAYHSGIGLDKFEQYDGVYWKEVFRVNDTVIYEVMQ
mgnify:CR=1 FL=1